MPAASSKPSSQNLETEVQDPVKLLIGALEKKTRNLEKRKTKLEGYKEMVDGGKSLNKDQEEAVSHYQEVQGNLNFAKEFLVTIQTVVNDTSKAKKKQEKKENLQRQEQELQRIQNILLLQNVLNQMGQEHIRNDFLSGNNGAELLVEADLTFLDEFYPLVSPTREDEETEEGTETPQKEKSFDEKIADAALHLDKFLKEDEGQVCGTTYKYLKEIVNRIHKCGYLDNIPEPPSQEVDAPTGPEVQEEMEEAVNLEEDEEISTSSMNPSHPIDSSEVSGFNQSGQTDVLPAKSQVIDIPNPPEPIEMPPSKPSHSHDVSDVLAPVEGGVTFLQESMLELDPSHVDPAVVAVMPPTQSYMSTAFQNSADSSSMDRQGTPSSQLDQSVDSLRQSAQTDSIYPSQPDSVYTQNIYETQQTLMGNNSQASMSASTGAAQHDFTSQQNLQTQQNMGGPQGIVTQQNMGGPQGIVTQQGYIDQSNFASQASLNSGPVGLANNQSSLSNVPTQGEYGRSTPQQQDYTNSQQQQQQDFTSSHQSLSGPRQSSSTGPVDNTQNVGYNSPANQNLSDLRDYRNSPIDPQLTEERQTTSSPGVYQSGSLQTSQFVAASEIPPKDGYGASQLKTDAAQPQSIPFPNEAQSSPSLPKEVLEEPTLPKSTMNAAAPPFQSVARASPQMPQTLHTPEDSNFSSSSMQAASDASHSAGKKSEESRSVEYRSSPPNIDNSYQYQSYPNNNYARNNRGNRGGRGGGTMSSPGGYRNARGGAGTGLPFMRNSPRFNNSNIQRGGYSQGGYMPSARESFQQRPPDIGYTQTAYNTFSRPQEPAYYRGRGGINRGAPRGGRGGTNIRGQMQYRGGRGGGGGYQKSGTPITA